MKTRNKKKSNLTLILMIIAALAIVAVLLFWNPESAVADPDPQSQEQLEASTIAKSGMEAPNFTVEMFDGESIRLSDLRGKVVLVNFWATWCPDCRKDVPKMKELYGKYASDNVIFIGISFDKNDEVWMKYIRENGMEWLQHREQKPKNESQVSIDYHVKWIPSIYVIGPDGKIMLGTVMIEKLEKLLETIGK